jgi:hypothetical protein
MSLHALANNMAAQGRGPDSTLVHMSPREVHGLQALAMANGGTLTINPQTGLPEAGFLDSLLPALIGFGLNTFVPGLGTAVGGMFGGLSGAAGTAIAVGGAYGLATGSLEKGLTAGLGAYGGAGLGSSLAGVPNTAADAGWGARDAGISAAAEASPAATAARLQAGANTAMSAPADFVKSNYMNLGMAAAPALSGAFDEQTSSAPKIHPGYIRKYDRDPVTGTLYQVSATPADQYTGGINFGGVPQFKYGANGGLMGYDEGGVTTDTTNTTNDKSVRFGGVPELDLTGRDMNDKRSDSERIQDYLMGMGPNPFTVYHKTSVERAGEATKEIAKLVEQQQKQRETGGGGSRTGTSTAGEGAAQFGGSGFTGSTTNSFGDSGPTTGAASIANSAAAALGNAGLVGLSNAIAANVNPNYGNEGRLANEKSLDAASDGPPAADPMGKDAAQKGESGGEGSGPTGPNGGATGSRASDGGWGGEGRGASGGSGDGKGDGHGEGGEGGGRGDGGGDGGGHGDGGGQARGGLLNLHRRSQSKRYDEGGTTKTVNFGGVGQLEPVNTSDAALSDSERTQNYLMGNGPNPFTFYHSNEKKVVPATKASDNTGIAAIRGTDLVDDNVGISRIGNGNLGSESVSNGFVGSGAAAGSSISPDAGANNSINPGWGSRDAGGGTPSAANPMELDPAQRAQASLVDMTSNSLTENPAVGEGGETVQSGYTNSLTQNSAVGEGGETGNSLIDNPAVGEIGDFTGDTNSSVFGVTNQPDDAIFDINNFDNNTSAGTVDNSVNDFGVGIQPASPTLDINDFDSNISSGPDPDLSKALTSDYDGTDFGVTNQPAGTAFDINNFNNNTSAGTVNTGDSGSYTGSAGDGMDNIDTSNSEIFSQEYVDPRKDPFEDAARLEQSEMNEGYFGGFDSGSDSGSSFGSGFGGGFGSGGGCPAPWINITLADGGTVKAGDIKPGMIVYTRHETTGEWGNFPVTVVRNGEDNRWTILFESGIEFVGTFNHPVMVDDAWVEIQHLKAGDKVVQPEGFAVVKSAKYFDHGPIVKIEVQDAHTYLTEGFLSHNKNMADYDFGNMRTEGFEFDDFYADGGTTGSGSIDLHVPINIGGGGGGNDMGGGKGDDFGGGFARDNPGMFGGMSQPDPDFLSKQQESLPGYIAMQKSQQDYNNSDEFKNFKNYAQEYQRQFQPQQQYSAFGGGMGGGRGGLMPMHHAQMQDQQMYPMAEGGIAALAQGGYNLGSYSDGGRLLRGPGDGVSDSIPATIGKNQPARLADGEFVVPARIVSELGNGSTEAGARKLYAMMDRVQKARTKTVGKNRVAANTRADKYLPV